MKIRGYGMQEINIENFSIKELEEAAKLIEVRLNDRKKLCYGPDEDRRVYFTNVVAIRGAVVATQEYRRLMDCSLAYAHKYIQAL